MTTKQNTEEKKPVTYTILLDKWGAGFEKTEVTVHCDELQMIDYYLEFVVIGDGTDYIILVDGVPKRWNLGGRRHE